jgi:nucleotide-binding universal stress UspA family protein
MQPIRTILCATDFSSNSEAALELACSLGRAYSARLLILHVCQPPLATLAGTQMVPPLPEEYGLKDAHEKLNALQVPPAVIPVERRALVGNPAEEIVRVATETPCELIVAGTHGRSGIGRLLMGSVAEAVLRKAPCPVLTVKAPLAMDLPAVQPDPSLARVAYGA